MKHIFLLLLILTAFTISAKPVVIPQPKQITIAEQAVILPSSFKIQIHGDFSSDILYENLQEVFPQWNQAKKDDGTTIELWCLESKALKKEYRKKHGKHIDKAEGYILDIKPNHILISAIDLRGMIYGIHTLKQLTEFKNNQTSIYPSRIEDYPSLSYRALHFYTGKGGLQDQLQMIDFMVDHKLNTLNFQLNHMEYKSFPELANENYLQPQSEIKELLGYAKRHQINVIPVITTLSHMRWFFYNDQHTKFRELLPADLTGELSQEPKDVHNYCPLEEGTYTELFKIFDEIVELFDPQYFHIGRDEITMYENFPSREETKKYSVTELMYIDEDKLFSYFEGKNIGLAIWSDMYLADGYYVDADNAENKTEAKQRRDDLKKLQKKYNIPELLIYDWHYAPAKPSSFNSVDTWTDEHFKVVGATSNATENIRNFTRKIIQEKEVGMVQTTWAGYSFAVEKLTQHHPQFEAYLLAADYFWSGRDDAAEDMSYDYKQRFWDYWYRRSYGNQHRQLDASPLSSEKLQTILSPQIKVIWHSGTQGKCEFQFYNPFETPYKATIDFEKSGLNGGCELMVYPNQTESFIRTVPAHFTELTAPINIKIETENKQKCVIKKTLSTYPSWECPKRSSEITINGDLSDWPAKPMYTFKNKGFIQIKEFWTPEDLSAESWWSYDKKNLYMAFKVQDNIHKCRPSEPLQLWQEDSLQLGFDLRAERQSWIDDNCFEWGFGLDDQKIVKTGYIVSYLNDLTTVNHVETAIKREGNYTIYECRIPRKLSKTLKIGDHFRFSFAINDNDGKEFTGGLVGSHGIYSTKRPEVYGNFNLK